MQKYYCYVDETGQDTEGKLFLVSVIILEKERDAIKEKLKNIEKESGKGVHKWSKARRRSRISYLRLILGSGLLRNSAFFSKYEDSKAYVDLTILSTAKAISQRAEKEYTATVLVDGLKREERGRFAAGLRKLRIKVRKVRGARDESDVFVRLADAIAGFMRDKTEEEEPFPDLYKEFCVKGILKQI
ncbi:hypothetical protein EPN28_00685 [Patescibacteria group bacterium]|nr:MAG: hypothetical protein EPN28_00685 [Patescibacteria group bacterium]